MEMAELMQLIKERQGETPNEVYANLMGIRGNTLHRYHIKDREIGLEALRKLFNFYRQQGDVEMLKALGAYAFKVQPDQLEIKINEKPAQPGR